MNTTTGISAYSKTNIESGVLAADPHKLISMLYEGALLAITNAKSGILRKDIPAKSKAITHAMLIIDEGLKASLDKNVGGKLAQDLEALYDYMCARLLTANLNNDTDALDEVYRLLSEIKGAWESIRQLSVSQAPVVTQSPIPTNKQSSLVYGRR